jgi:hypothetical protein
MLNFKSSSSKVPLEEDTINETSHTINETEFDGVVEPTTSLAASDLVKSKMTPLRMSKSSSKLNNPPIHKRSSFSNLFQNNHNNNSNHQLQTISSMMQHHIFDQVEMSAESLLYHVRDGNLNSVKDILSFSAGERDSSGFLLNSNYNTIGVSDPAHVASNIAKNNKKKIDIDFYDDVLLFNI